jgi:hypothetical protein
MDAQIVGLIVLDNGLSCNLCSESEPATLDSSWLEHSLQEIVPNHGTSTHRLPQLYETTFMRADIRELNRELESQFNELLVRLFESQ